MNGPAAPKDPEQRRPYFYIMKDKDIFGSTQEDGRGIQYLYQSQYLILLKYDIRQNDLLRPLNL